MFSTTIIPPDTIRAYRETHFRVFSDPPTTLMVDEANPSLAAIHNAAKVGCSAFITACNPFSEQYNPAANARRQEMLAIELRHRDVTFISGVGQHPSSDWEEASFLVLGMSLEDAKACGTQHGQNAIVWSGADALPQLILLR